MAISCQPPSQRRIVCQYDEKSSAQSEVATQSAPSGATADAVIAPSTPSPRALHPSRAVHLATLRALTVPAKENVPPAYNSPSTPSAVVKTPGESPFAPGRT